MGVVIMKPRIVPAWLAATQHLELHGRECRNIVLEIAQPHELPAGDRVALDKVDAALIANTEDLCITTVATTIFPQRMYARLGADKFRDHFLKVMKRAKKKGTWGTYAMRMLERRGKVAGSTFNPLEQVIEKLKYASTVGQGFKSNYEMGVHLVEDLDETEYEVAAELPTWESATDGAKPLNIPCLSHLTFKMIEGCLELTAIYRSHYYGTRALGNLVGLSQLQRYVATQAGLKIGTLTCISTHAVLDYAPLGGVAAGKKLLASLQVA